MSANVPGAPIITFNSDQWRMLERFIDETKLDLDGKFIKAVAGLRLDGSLETDLHPGSPDWDVVKKLNTAAASFGNSVQSRFTALSGDWDTFLQALVDGERIFENHNDLATMTAQELLTEDPDLTPGSGGV